MRPFTGVSAGRRGSLRATATCRRYSGDYQRFSNRGRYTAYMAQLSAGEQAQLEPLLEHYEHGGLVQSDPPEHTRLRRLVNQAFTPRVVKTMRTLVEEIVNELLEGMAERERAELITDFAFPLPATVIAGVLGVEAAERDQFGGWSAKIQRFLGSGDAHFPYALEAQESWGRMNAIFAALLDQRRREPQEDLITALAQAQDEGAGLKRRRDRSHLRRDAHRGARDDHQPHRQRHLGAPKSIRSS